MYKLLFFNSGKGDKHFFYFASQNITKFKVIKYGDYQIILKR